MKLSRIPLMLMLILIFITPKAAFSYTVRPTHPRIYITPDNIEAIRARCMGSPGLDDGIQDDYYTSLKNWADSDISISISGGYTTKSGKIIKYGFLAQMGEIQGHSYNIAYNGKIGVNAYAAKGIAYLKSLVNSGEGYGVVLTIDATLMGYDWLYEKMTHEDRQEIVNAIISIADNEKASAYKHHPFGGTAFRERYYSFLGLAFYGDGINDTKAQEYLNDWNSWWLDEAIASWKIAERGGGFSFGQYGVVWDSMHTKTELLLHMFDTATDMDIWQDFDYGKYQPLFYIYNLIPYNVPPKTNLAKAVRNTGSGIVRFGDDAGYNYGGQIGRFQFPGNSLYWWEKAFPILLEEGDSDLYSLYNWFVRYHCYPVREGDGGEIPECQTCLSHPYSRYCTEFQLVYDLVFRDEDVPPISPTDLNIPLTHMFGTTDTGPAIIPDFKEGTPEGVGIVSMRTAWEDPDATFVWYKASSYDTTHYHDDAGSFQIYKKGWLAIDSGQYEDNYWDGQYGRRTIAHNSMIIYMPGEYTPSGAFLGGSNDGGQRVIDQSSIYREDLVPGGKAHRGGINRFESKANEYDYIHSDITRAYNSIYHTDFGNEAKVSLVQRDLVFLRPDYVVVFDRVNSTDAEYPKRWLVHSVYRPQLNGTETFSGIIPYSTNIPDKPNGVSLRGDTHAGISESYDTDVIQIEGWKSNPNDPNQPAEEPSEGRLLCKTLLPKHHITRIVGGSDYEFMDAEYNNYSLPGKHGPQHEMFGSWRIEVEPTGSDYPENYNTFLHVLYPTDNTVNQIPEIQLIESTSGQEVQGAFIVGNPNKAVIFAKNNEEIASTTFNIPSIEQTDVLIVDLEANSNYYYEKDGQTIELSKTNNGGILRKSSDQGTLYVAASSFEYVIDDFTVYPVPDIPEPARGVSFTDPNFHTTITRITDQDADDYYGSGIVNAYATHDIENSDGRYLILHSLGDRWYLYDAISFKLIKQLSILQDGTEPECRWDHQDPDIFYYRYGMGFYKYDVSTDAYTLLHDFKDDYASATRIWNKYEGDSSADSRYWAFKVSIGSSSDIALVVYDKDYYGQNNGKIVGSMSPSGGCDWISMSPSGNRVIVGWYYSSGNYITAYDRDFSNPTPLKDKLGVPHCDLGVDINGNDVWIYENTVGGGDDCVYVVDITTGERTKLFPIEFYSGGGDLHYSGNCIATPGWVLVSTSWKNGVEAQGWQDKHLFMVELDLKKSWDSQENRPRIWRIAHTHQPGSDYWTEAFATINNEGTKVFWASNWDIVGTHNGLEVYQVELPENWWSDLSGVPGNIPPIANASASPTSGEAPLLVAFSGSGSDSDGTVVSYLWNFGDGQTSTAQYPFHTYNTAGNYTATLTVTDNDGGTGSDTVSISVSGGGVPNNPPTASVTANPTSGDAPLAVSFTGSGTDSDGSIVSYSWNFGDGSSSSVQNPFHVYGIPGDYVARLSVTDDEGATGTDTVSISVALASGQSMVVFGDAPGSDFPDTCSDTFINVGESSVNYSTHDEYLNTYTWPVNTVANRIVMKWDLSMIPTDSVIQNATLSLYMFGYEGTGGDGQYDISVHKIVNNNPVISACTWNNYDDVNAWTGGSNGGAQDMAPAEDQKSVDKTPGYKSWTITYMVQDWVSNPSSNYGLILDSDSTASRNSNRSFRPTEYANPDQTPKLLVIYGSGSPSGSPAPEAPTGLRVKTISD